MDRLTCMEAFIRVADAESFATAARRWGRSKAAVSKYVAHYEAHLGARLFQRTTRSVSLTDSGRAHYDRVQQVLSLAAESEAKLREEHVSLRGRLRVSAPPGLLSLERDAVLAPFLEKHPEIQLDLDITHRLVDLVEERIDVAIRVMDPEDSSLIARKLAPVSVVLVASPGYLNTRGRPRIPEDIPDHSCIVDRNNQFPAWPFVVEGRRVSVPIEGRVRVNDTFTARDLAMAGVGITLVPKILVRSQLEEGSLVELLEGYGGISWSVYAVTSERRFLAARTRAFIQHLKQVLPSLMP